MKVLRPRWLRVMSGGRSIIVKLTRVPKPIATKSYKPVRKNLVTSGRFHQPTAKSLVVRESPNTIYPKGASERRNWLRTKTSGMGKAKWIDVPNALKMGNSHAYHLNPLPGSSATRRGTKCRGKGMMRRQRLNGDWCATMGLANPSVLKIQSGPSGNTAGYTDGRPRLQQLDGKLPLHCRGFNVHMKHLCENLTCFLNEYYIKKSIIC